MRSKNPYPVPQQMSHIFRMKMAGVSLTYADYQELPAVVRDDLILWELAATRARENGS